MARVKKWVKRSRRRCLAVSFRQARIRINDRIQQGQTIDAANKILEQQRSKSIEN